MQKEKQSQNLKMIILDSQTDYLNCPGKYGISHLNLIESKFEFEIWLDNEVLDRKIPYFKLFKWKKN